jgi:hypothetical protein
MVVFIPLLGDVLEGKTEELNIRVVRLAFGRNIREELKLFYDYTFGPGPQSPCSTHSRIVLFF